MFPSSGSLSVGRSAQRGFALVAAVFIVVILAGIAAYMVSVSSQNKISAGLDLQGSRALQAARSGMDWGISRVINAPASFGAGNCKTGTPTVNLSSLAGGDLPGHAGFTISVKCTSSAYTDNVALVSYALEATACNEPNASGTCPNTGSPSADYVERRVTTQVMCNASGPC
jgi:MSHA biogenesis protein MshP